LATDCNVALAVSLHAPTDELRDKLVPINKVHPIAELLDACWKYAEGQASRWHAVASDEVWHLYEGGPLELLVAPPDVGRVERAILGRPGDGALPTYTVAARCWQAARPLGAYVLTGCSVGPGFEFADFRMLADDPRGASALREAAPDLLTLL